MRYRRRSRRKLTAVQERLLRLMRRENCRASILQSGIAKQFEHHVYDMEDLSNTLDVVYELREVMKRVDALDKQYDKLSAKRKPARSANAVKPVTTKKSKGSAKA